MPRSQSPDVFAMSEANRTHLLARRGDRGGGARKSQPIGIESIYKHKLRKLFRFAQLNYAKKMCNFIYRLFYYRYFSGVNERDKILAHERQSAYETINRQFST